MRDRAAFGAIAALGLTLAGCGHPEQKVVDQYFTAVNQKDQQTLSSFAVVGFDKKVDKWSITKSGEEKREPAPLTALVKKRNDADAAVAENKKKASAYALDHIAEVDQVREAHKKGASVPAKLQGVAAEWDKFNQADRELKKAAAEAKDAVEKEKRNVVLSVGQLDDLESLTGEMISKQSELELTVAGEPKKYTMSLRKYEVGSGDKGPRVVSRWVVYGLN
jgi:septal ring factor EnvC (AmiA/AmiB activator)